jgi:DnaK suppressor protein
MTGTHDEFASMLAQHHRDAVEAERLAARELSAIRAARAEAVADDEHDPEGSTLSGDWSRLEGLHREAVARIAAIDRARERLASGTYGVCVTCGTGIPIERLRVRPAAEQCVRCAERA